MPKTHLMIPAPFDAYLVIITIFLTFFLAYKEWVRPSVGFLGAVLIFIISGILPTEELLNGFSNPSIASIILLILLTAGIRKNFNIEYFFDKIFKSAKTYRSFLLLMMAQVSFISSFMNNTPVVAAMTPYVFNWGKKKNISPSKLLIPLSFATICGGMITLIGTSTTLVLNGFLTDIGLPGLNTFNLFLLGLSVTITFIVFIFLFGNKLLPDHTDLLEEFKKNKREYLVETTLSPFSNLVNKSIKEAGLRNLKGVYLVEIVRKSTTISPVEPSEIIDQNDTLIFAGNTTDIVELVKSDHGLMLPDPSISNSDGQINVMEAVISNGSSLIGKKVKDTDFRNRYDAAIVAIHRNGEKLRGKIGEIKISAGDLLLVYAGSNFRDRVDLYRDIYIVSSIKELFNAGRKKKNSLIGIGLIAIILLAFGFFSLFTSLLIIFTLMIGLGMITRQDIKRELDVNMIAILVLSLALGQATISSGAAEIISRLIMDILLPLGPMGVLCGLLILTTVLTSFITNVGAVAIAFPLAYSISSSMNIPGEPFYLGIAFAASAAFITPIGYQTNLIIYGPGGYNFKDFFRIGIPVTLVYLITVIIGLVVLYPDL